ncbi:MAG: choice-of-anchor A family protein [Pirellulales bacterium]|nr:choice-of-anchor A family protein [Pirellulales bacterium]
MRSMWLVCRADVLSAPLALAVLLLCGSSAEATILNDYSLVVTGNLRSSSEVEGRVLVGGDINGINNSSSNYGIHLDAGAYSGVDTLLVGGDINPTINLNAGHARIGGSVAGGINANNGSTWVDGDATVAAEVAAASSELTNLSNYLYSFGGDSVSLPGSQPAAVNFSATPNSEGVAFFHIGNGSNLFDNDKVQQMSLTMGSADFVVINVGGTYIHWNHGNMVGEFTTEMGRSRVLWNFYEATYLNTHSRGFNGSLLAPLSFLRVEGVVEGSVFVKSFRQMGEVHLPVFAMDTFPGPPDPGPSMPEPSTLLLAVWGLLVAAASRRRSVR